MKKERKSGHTTRLKILEAARKIFLARGYSGASMDDIARTAEVNKSLIFHHFASKQNLWKMVKSSIITRAGEHKVDLCTTKGLPYFIESALRARFDLYEQYPDLARMIAWQKLEQDQATHLEGTPHLPSFTAWIGAIKQLQKQGDMRSDIDASLVVDFIFSQRPEKSYLEAGPVQKQKYFEIVAKAIRAALTPIADTSG